MGKYTKEEIRQMVTIYDAANLSLLAWYVDNNMKARDWITRMIDNSCWFVWITIEWARDMFNELYVDWIPDYLDQILVETLTSNT